MSGPAFTRDFDQVAAAESEWIDRRRAAVGQPPLADDLVAVAFSGGGIRSATVNLGVLQALEERGLMKQVDMLSSVSGGGYIASCYSWLRATTPNPDAPTFEQPLVSGERVIDWLRANAKFLIAGRGFSMLTLFAAILASTLMNLLVLLPPLLLIIELATLNWLSLPAPLAEFLGVPGHHGFWLLLLVGSLSLAAFVPLMLAFALRAGHGGQKRHRHMEWLRLCMGQVLTVGLALFALGSIPLLVGTVDQLLSTHMPSMSGNAVHVTWVASLLSSLLAMSRGDSSCRLSLQPLAMIGVALLVYGLVVVGYALVSSVDLHTDPVFYYLLALSAVLAIVCNLNAVSMHGYYRARLTHAFMPHVHRQTRASDFRMDRIGPERGQPLHLINTTLNTSSAESVLARARQGASFFYSPLYQGSSATGYGLQEHSEGADADLANAFTVSAAAIDPDTAVTSARSVSVLMALLNVRLGYWARNPAPDAEASPPLPNWWLRIGREMSGLGLNGQQREIHLSDGGGFENLALYELIRRRARHVLVVDAGYDPTLALADLGRAIERVRVDFGAEIEMAIEGLCTGVEASAGTALQGRSYLTGRIRYADGSQGVLLLVKPLLCPGLSADVYAYWRSNPAFPNEPTSDQFYDEPQFEAYRRLGYAIVNGLIGEQDTPDFRAWLNRLADM